jgi:acyl dehydratase
MSKPFAPYSIVAFNAAKLSENKMHDDTVAKKFGFTGGLVPGVDVCAYMSHAPLTVWGRAFLERGHMEGRFGKPIYDGETATVTAVERDGGLDIQIESRGVVCGSGRATLPAAASSAKLDDFKLPAMPPEHERRPPADEASYKVGAWLGIRPFTFSEHDQAEYVKSICEADPIYAKEGIIHSGTILRACNWVLTHNAKMGPWIHVGSTIQHLAPGHVGEEISVRALVTKNFENKGHKIVELDALVIANKTPIARVAHSAIYEPRQVRAA